MPLAQRMHLGALAAITGGALWLLIWVLYFLIHGPGPDDRQGYILTLTHYDYSKFMVVPLALFAVALTGLHSRQRGRSRRLTATGYVLALIALVVTAIGVALSLWPIPWGVYTVDWEAPLPMWGGLLSSLSTFALALGLFVFGIGTWRAGVWPSWVALALIVGALSIVPWLHMTIFGWIFSAAWLLPGYALWSATSEQHAVGSRDRLETR
ncbi:MAG TPA: hypothetical protein VGW38_27760 [Chloroflexota bacterium]|nr:hypothetical protein [Chloroflexota bacterium]